jgi:hypothetical protein
MVDMKAIEEIKEMIDQIDEFPEVDMSDEELGLFNV